MPELANALVAYARSEMLPVIAKVLSPSHPTIQLVPVTIEHLADKTEDEQIKALISKDKENYERNMEALSL